MREKDGAAARITADGRLLPVMERRAGNHKIPTGTACAALAMTPVGAAATRAELACIRKKKRIGSEMLEFDPRPIPQRTARIEGRACRILAIQRHGGYA